MRPYNLEAMNDDYQDVRVLALTKDYAEVEVICYPLNTNAQAIPGNPHWQRDYAGMTEYLAPGVTTNWDAKMQQDLLGELRQSGIDLAKLTDKEVVEQVSRWLYSRAKYRSMFGTHYVHFPSGKPTLFPGLEPAFQREKGEAAWTVEEQFAHELLGKEMFYHRTHGTCTSSAVYQATVLRAIGIPTRIIIAIPLADASDPEQVALVEKGLTHHQVRTTALYGLYGAGNSYTAHTFLEVYVGHRWRRLNYTQLGQNILDPHYLGLMLHVHTFHDLSDAQLAPTWGARFALAQRDEVFRHKNPYRTLLVEDHFGRYAQILNPPAQKEHRQITLTRAYWQDAPQAPKLLREQAGSRLESGAARFYVHGEEWFSDAGDYLQYKAFLRRSDPDFLLKAPGQPDVKCRLSLGFITLASEGVREMEVVIPPAEYAKMVRGVSYTLHPVNAVPTYHWQVKPGLTLTRALSLEEKIELLLDRIDRLEKRLEALERKDRK
jgi:hypothetical protein